jgi:tetratricopeptide (TPR) repeat protein
MFIRGMEGLGTSALAVRLYDDDPTLFGEKLIWVPGRDADGNAMSPGEILRTVLRGLGVPTADQEGALPNLAEEYQRVSRGKRFMVVVDDAAAAEALRLLIPVFAPEAVVLVTTPRRMRALIEADFEEFVLDKLSEDESLTLLRDRLGVTAERISDSDQHELAALCDGFPLLIRILAARIKDQPHVVPGLLADLRESIAALVGLDDEKRIEKFLDFAYHGLDVDQARCFRLLSLLPGPHFGVDAAAVALGMDADGAGRLMDTLVDANLLLRTDRGPIRYSLHEVARVDARARAREIRETDRVAVLEWYLEQAAMWDAALSGRWREGPVFDRLRMAAGVVPSRADALTWFEVEWPNVVAAVQAAQEDNRHDIATQLCVALFKYLHMNGLVDAWIACHEAGLASARAVQDHRAIMQLTSQRGAAYLAAAEYGKAYADFAESLASASAVNSKIGEQSALEWLGKVVAAQGDTAAAMDFYARSWQVIDAAGDEIDAVQRPRAYATLRLQIARVLLMTQDWDRAAAEASESLAYFTGQVNPEIENQAKCLLVQGEAMAGAGDSAGAVAAFQRAVDLFDVDSARRNQARALELLADALAVVGERDRAADAFGRALVILDDVGSPNADRIRAKLAELGQ